MNRATFEHINDCRTANDGSADGLSVQLRAEHAEFKHRLDACRRLAIRLNDGRPLHRLPGLQEDLEIACGLR